MLPFLYNYFWIVLSIVIVILLIVVRQAYKQDKGILVVISLFLILFIAGLIGIRLYVPNMLRENGYRDKMTVKYKRYGIEPNVIDTGFGSADRVSVLTDDNKVIIFPIADYKTMNTTQTIQSIKTTKEKVAIKKQVLKSQYQVYHVARTRYVIQKIEPMSTNLSDN